jgi:hypothetical protein
MRRADKVKVILGITGASTVLLGLTAFIVEKFKTRKNPGAGRTAVVGDSIAAGAFVGILDSSLPTRSFTNFGVVGSGTNAIKRSLQNNVLGRNFDEVIIEGGLNDMSRDDAVSYITNNLSEMVRMAKADGLEVVLTTVTPYHAEAVKIRELNNIILRNGKRWGADVVVDIHSPIADISGGLQQSLVGDRMGLHPNRTGHRLIAQSILQSAYR